MSNAVGCSVRVARSDDLGAILRIHHQSHAADDQRANPSAREQATWSRMMNTPDLIVYLAELDDQPVGTATVMIMPNLTYGCAPTAFIEAVVVVPEVRRRGIATAIIGRVLDEARSAGCHKVQLLSHKRHVTDGAHDLYTTLGFEPEAEGFRLYLTPKTRLSQ